MRNVITLLILTVAMFLTGCGFASQEIDLIIPTPTTQSLHCSSDDKPLITEQVAYKGMLAGQTTFDEVKAFFGEPTDNIGTTFWFEREDPAFWITLEGEIVDEIRIHGDLPLYDLISTYGCPDILTHIKPNDFGDMEEIEWVELVYLDAGIDFSYPSSLSYWLDVDDIYYFPPMGEEDFFQRYPHLEREHPMTWAMLYVEGLD